MGIILAFHPQSRILLARQDGPVANKLVHWKKRKQTSFLNVTAPELQGMFVSTKHFHKDLT